MKLHFKPIGRWELWYICTLAESCCARYLCEVYGILLLLLTSPINTEHNEIHWRKRSMHHLYWQFGGTWRPCRPGEQSATHATALWSTLPRARSFSAELLGHHHHSRHVTCSSMHGFFGVNSIRITMCMFTNSAQIESTLVSFWLMVDATKQTILYLQFGNH